MNALRIFNCLCDETRLRMLNLLLDGPLCVCHFAQILDLAQPKISRHLKVLRDSGTIETERCDNWTVCRLPAKRNPFLKANLRCLQDARSEEALFLTDLKRRQRLIEQCRKEETPAAGPAKCIS